MKPNFETALARITEVVMFENWLRFYFVEETEDDTLIIRLPDMALAKLRTHYGHLAGLAERLNSTEINHKTSLNAVCLFVASEIDGVLLPEALIGEVFDSTRFHLELQLFSSWVQSHEEQLDEAFMEYSLWLQLYREWKNSDAVKEHIASAQEATERNARVANDTTH